MAKEYIDRNELIENLNKFAPEHYNALINQLIVKQPTADVAEVKHGEWIYNTDDFTPKMRCSCCGYNKPLVAGENIEQEPNDYCNKCGAKMDGERRDT